jgi:hypothetical protein
MWFSEGKLGTFFFAKCQICCGQSGATLEKRRYWKEDDETKWDSIACEKARSRWNNMEGSKKRVEQEETTS